MLCHDIKNMLLVLNGCSSVGSEMLAAYFLRREGLNIGDDEPNTDEIGQIHDIKKLVQLY